MASVSPQRTQGTQLCDCYKRQAAAVGWLLSFVVFPSCATSEVTGVLGRTVERTEMAEVRHSGSERIEAAIDGTRLTATIHREETCDTVRNEFGTETVQVTHRVPLGGPTNAYQANEWTSAEQRPYQSRTLVDRHPCADDGLSRGSLQFSFGPFHRSVPIGNDGTVVLDLSDSQLWRARTASDFVDLLSPRGAHVRLSIAAAIERVSADAFFQAELANTISAYEAYLRQFPRPAARAALARQRIEALADATRMWQVALRTNSPDDYDRFASAHPQDPRAPEARDRAASHRATPVLTENSQSSSTDVAQVSPHGNGDSVVATGNLADGRGSTDDLATLPESSPQQTAEPVSGPPSQEPFAEAARCRSGVEQAIQSGETQALERAEYVCRQIIRNLEALSDPDTAQPRNAARSAMHRAEAARHDLEHGGASTSPSTPTSTSDADSLLNGARQLLRQCELAEPAGRRPFGDQGLELLRRAQAAGASRITIDVLRSRLQECH